MDRKTFEQKIDQALLEIKVQSLKAFDNLSATNWDDAKNTRNDWIAYVISYLGRASEKVFRNEKENLDSREMLVKAGGLLVSCISYRDSQ